MPRRREHVHRGRLSTLAPPTTAHPNASANAIAANASANAIAANASAKASARAVASAKASAKAASAIAANVRAVASVKVASARAENTTTRCTWSKHYKSGHLCTSELRECLAVRPLLRNAKHTYRPKKLMGWVFVGKLRR